MLVAYNYGFMNMLTLSVPSITPNISVLPVINGQQLVSLTISVDVSFYTLALLCIFACHIIG